MPILRFSKVYTLKVQPNGNKIDKEETNNRAIQLYNNRDTSLSQLHNKCQEYSHSDIDNLLYGHLPSLRPFHYTKKPLP